MKRKTVAIILIAAILSCMFGGCGSKSDSAQTQDKGDSSQTAAAPKELVYAQSMAITSLDPAGMQPQGLSIGL